MSDTAAALLVVIFVIVVLSLGAAAIIGYASGKFQYVEVIEVEDNVHCVVVRIVKNVSVDCWVVEEE